MNAHVLLILTAITITTPEITAAFITNAAGILLSLAGNYIPGWREKFAAYTSEQKSLFMLGSLFLVSLAIGVLSWTGALPLVPATPEGIWFLVFTFVSSVISNQTTYAISPQVKKVKTIKAARKKSAGGGE